ncbi:UDP-glucose--hexose-1-phosphate uridylyltransferase [Pediococcus stilesii]|uniref:Galactose-1-phosphate uridylyltransferase n=1 Tax=Pediococcus stilesii TaxID=331679 RepID=A0A0R2KSN6_9LACO|nr:UDP-glucose--hexose-1-phosphate uridylyltransferase [Pediococcus stilesii]KRN92448.1 hypothetical protein IV81_GL001165 [Pediococcus stilesii]
MSSNAIQALLELGHKTRAVQTGDERYVTNRVLALIGDQADSPDTPVQASTIIEQLTQVAIRNQKIDNTITDREILAGQLMDLITPRPSSINQRFNRINEENGSRAATDYFYELCRLDNDIQTAAIAKNIEYTAAGLEVTINLSKPEKDPKAIAQAAKTASATYPQCQLCLENEGYLGRVGYPARSNHRIIKMQVNSEPWGFQYSPYAYFQEHAIFIDQIHRPMKINRQTFENLIEIVEKFPHYFVGSNADLPIVGGSMLSHEHYQGGRHVFPMMKAPIVQNVRLNQIADVTAGIIQWPMTAIRLKSTNREAIVDAAETIREKWQGYSDATLDIRATSNGQKHHTVTPIAYRKGADFIIDIVLRDNQTSAQYPDGIFHPHQDVQHIKKENIGLIEVMGRAIFPPRLIPEMEEVKSFLLNQPNAIADYHRQWAEELRQHNSITADNVEEVIQDGIGATFKRVLEDAGVFKWDSAGREGLQKFISKLN